MRRQRRAALGVLCAALLAGPLAACTSPSENAHALDLCDSYQRLFAQVDGLEATADPDDLRDQADALARRLHRIQAAADNGWDTQYEDVAEKAADLGSAAVAASRDAQRESRKQITEDLDDLRVAVALLKDEVNPECG